MLTPSQVSVSGTVRKQVVCELCGHEYGYEMTRTGVGSYHDFAWNDQDGQEEARPRAEEALREKLETECDVVPCPKCGALTREMREQEVRTLWQALGLALLGGGLAVFAAVAVSNQLYGLWHIKPFGLLWVCLFGLGGLVLSLVSGFAFVAALATFVKRKSGRSAPGRAGPSAAPPDPAGSRPTPPATGGPSDPGMPEKAPRIQEESRSLKEFYPAPSVRHKVHYGFVHCFLPRYIHENPHRFFASLLGWEPPSAADPGQFLQSCWAWYEQSAGLIEPEGGSSPARRVSRRVTDLRLSVHEIAGQPVALIHLPAPEGPLEAFFVAVVLLAPAVSPERRPADVRARILTLEAEMDGPPDARPQGVLCEWTSAAQHQCLGMRVPAEAATFLRAVSEALQMPEAPFAAGFTVPKEGQPPKVTLSGAGPEPPIDPEADRELQGMLAAPQLIPGQLFPRDGYLPAISASWLKVIGLRQGWPNVCEEASVECANECCGCVRLCGFVVWVFDLARQNASGETGLGLFVRRAKPRGTRVPAPERGACLEQILDRGVFRVRLEPPPGSQAATPEGGGDDFRNVGWYVAGLVPVQAALHSAPERPSGAPGWPGVVSGGDGSSPEHAVRLDMGRFADQGLRELAGIRCEHLWIERHFPGARVRAQRLDGGAGKAFDVLTVVLPSGEEKDIWFEITSFFQEEEPAQVITADDLTTNPRHWLAGFLAVLVVVPLVVWGAGLSITGPVLVAFVTLGVGLALLVWLRPPPFLKSARVFGGRLHLASAALCLGLTLELVAIWHLFPTAFIPRACVYVDNASETDVQLWLDGHRWISPGRKTSQRHALGQGPHLLQTRSQDGRTVLEQAQIHVGDAGPYVLNVLGAQTYYAGAKEYGLENYLPMPKPQPKDSPIKSRWFRAEADYLFEWPPPFLPRERSGAYSYRRETRTYLLREPLVGSMARLQRRSRALLNAMSNRPGLAGGYLPSLIPHEIVSEEVSITNGNVILAGTFLVPSLEEPVPGILLMGGAARQDRDGSRSSVPGYRPYADLAEKLAQHGLAVLRCDTRGVRNSTGSYAAATAPDFLSDSRAAFEFLWRCPDIATNRVGLLGLGQAALLVPVLAAGEARVAFVVSLGGWATDGRSSLLQGRQREALARGINREEAAELVEEDRRVFDLALAGKGEEVQAALQESILKRLRELPAERTAASGGVGAIAARRAAEGAAALRSPWFQWLLAHDFGADWERVSVPILAVFGRLDVECDAAVNQAALEKALARGGNTNLVVVALPDANHLFVQARTGSVAEYPALPKRLARGLPENITLWLLRQTKTPGGKEPSSVGKP